MTKFYYVCAACGYECSADSEKQLELKSEHECNGE